MVDNYTQAPAQPNMLLTQFSDQWPDDLQREFDVEGMDKVLSFHRFQSLSHWTYRRLWIIYPPPVLLSNGFIKNSGKSAPFEISSPHHIYFWITSSISTSAPSSPVVLLMHTEEHVTTCGFASRNRGLPLILISTQSRLKRDILIFAILNYPSPSNNHSRCFSGKP